MHPEDQPVQAQACRDYPEDQPVHEQVCRDYSVDAPDSRNKEWKPSRSECLREHEVGIRFLTLGCIIQVGCKSIPFATVREGMEALNEYVAKPYEMVRIWEERFNEEEL